MGGDSNSQQTRGQPSLRNPPRAPGLRLDIVSAGWGPGLGRGRGRQLPALASAPPSVPGVR